MVVRRTSHAVYESGYHLMIRRQLAAHGRCESHSVRLITVHGQRNAVAMHFRHPQET
jgi:hypothetical protein